MRCELILDDPDEELPFARVPLFIPTSAAGELVFHEFGAIAHFERRLTIDCTRDGIAAARACGKVPGRPALDADKLASALKLIDAAYVPLRPQGSMGLALHALPRARADPKCRAVNPGA